MRIRKDRLKTNHYFGKRSKLRNLKLHFNFRNKRNNILNSRLSQHEMVGFILIVIMVVIIGLIALVFYLKGSPVAEYKNENVANFLQASMLYTTNCAINFVPEYENLEDLIKSCYRNEKCLNEKMACFVLNETLSEIMNKSWLIGSERPVNAYSIFIYYSENKSVEGKKEILRIEKGNCTGNRIGAEHLIHYNPGSITTRAEICYTSQ